MERRAILAAVLMAALLMIYQTFFMPSGPEPPPGSKTAESPAPVPAPSAPAPAKPASPLPPPRSREASPTPPQRLVSVETPLYTAVVSSEGGKFQEFTLRYRGEKPMVLLGELGPTGLAMTTEADARRRSFP